MAFKSRHGNQSASYEFNPIDLDGLGFPILRADFFLLLGCYEKDCISYNDTIRFLVNVNIFKLNEKISVRASILNVQL